MVNTSRLSNYDKRQLRQKPTVEVFEKNFNKLSVYNQDQPSAVFKDSCNSIDTVLYRKEPNVNFVSDALDFSNITFIADTYRSDNDKITASQNQQLENVDLVKFQLLNTKIKSLYNYLRNNLNLFRKSPNELLPVEVSLIIKKLIFFNNTLNQRTKYVHRYINHDENTTYYKNINGISRSTYSKTNKIFNGLRAGGLSLYDYGILINFYYRKVEYSKAIELIMELENKNNGLLPTNIMLIKMEIMTKNVKNNRDIYGLNMYKSSRKLPLKKRENYLQLSSNFETLINNFEEGKKSNKYYEDCDYIDFLIRGLGYKAEIDSLDKLLEIKYGIKIDRNGSKSVYILEQFNINKNVSNLIIPNENILISILDSYTKNGDLAIGIEVNNLMIKTYFNGSSKKCLKYWTFALKCVGVYSDAVENFVNKELKQKNLVDSLGNSLLDIKYRMFDLVWDLSTKNLNTITADLIYLKIKYSSVDKLIEDLPIVEKQLLQSKLNLTESNIKVHQEAFFSYVRTCCLELAVRNKFLDANNVIDKFLSSEEQKSNLRFMLNELQEEYAMKKIKDERKRITEDDNDFQLW